ncbi:MAG: AAA family ATPase [Lachnospiraceae bacterium]|nr:AAA family ATPase [Lachnospiraceae bacterium]
MGLYLNSRKPYNNYQEVVQSDYFVDKTGLLKELLPIVGPGKDAGMKGLISGQNNKYICIIRPRRFGKTIAANMVASYFGRGYDSHYLFDGLKVSYDKLYEKHLNSHNVISITCSEMPRDCHDYKHYIDRIQERMLKDLIREFPKAQIGEKDALWDAFNNIYELEKAEKFIFVLDEWDYIFHKDFVSDSDKNSYINFLSNLLKDQPYVELAYMTGILPISKYSSGSELNMFFEYTMASEKRFCEYFGFLDTEVDQLYDKYLSKTDAPKITREELGGWYDGYHTMSGQKVYNPRSVVAALTNNNLGNYWTSSGPYDEIFYYVEKNIDDVRDEVALLVSGLSVPAKVTEYAAASTDLSTKEEIFSAMVVYGFLSSENGKVSIPNRELMGKFEEMLMKEPALGYVYRLARESDRMLKATLSGNVDEMAQILEYAHNTETPLLHYSNETELTALVNLVYLSARDFYRVEREDKTGTGFVDFIFYPKDKKADGIILELKVDHTPEEAIAQIKDRNYALRFEGKLGEKPEYEGRILAAGIAFDRKSKKHSCKIEVLRGQVNK